MTDQTTSPGTHAVLKLSGIEQLKPPGSESNYLDWSFVLKIHLQATGVDHVLTPPQQNPKLPTWFQDNVAVCSVITRTIHPANYRYIRDAPNDASRMWAALQNAHQDSTTGGRMYWLRKLVQAKMTGSDIEAHIDEMGSIAERLNALVTPDSPLTPDDVHSAALLISLPSDWINCVSALMNEERVPSSKIVHALKQESLRRRSRGEDAEHPISVSFAKSRPSASTTPDESLYCSFCKRSGHDLVSCNTVSKVLSDYKSKRYQNRIPSRQTSSQSRRTPPVKAGRTSVVELFDDSQYHQDDSDYSGSELDVCAKSASVSLLRQSGTSHPGDFNLDSGCSVSMTPHRNLLKNQVSVSIPVKLADASTITATHSGLLHPFRGHPTSVKTLVVPDLHEPLLSISSLCDNNVTAVFTTDACKLYNAESFTSSGTLLGEGYRKDNLFYLPSAGERYPISNGTSLPSAAVTSTLDESDTSLFGYHRRLSHIGLKPLKTLLRLTNTTPTLMNTPAVLSCPTCIQSKMHRTNFKSRSPYRSTHPGQVVHSDVCSYDHKSREGYVYVITFIDDYSKHTSAYPMKLKSEALSCFKIFRASFEKSGVHKILTLHTDNGGEYFSSTFTSYLSTNGIQHTAGPPYSPQSNGVAERTNRTLTNLVRCNLTHAGMPKTFWADALRHLMFSFNSIPSKSPAGFKPPNQLLKLPLVNVFHLRPFGCQTYYKVPDVRRGKLDPTGRISSLLSYLPNCLGYVLWDGATKSVVKSRDVIFFPSIFPFTLPTSAKTLPTVVELPWPTTHSPPPVLGHIPTDATDEPPLNIPLPPRFDRRITASMHAPHNRIRNTSIERDSDSSDSADEPHPITSPDMSPTPSVPARDTSPSLSVPAPPLLLSPPAPPTNITPSLAANPAPPRTSTRIRRPPTRLGNWANITSTTPVVDTPKTWNQLLKSANKDKWLKAADEEFSSLLGMETWRLVPRPAKRRIIKSKWVFKVKHRPDHSIQKLKARLVAMGYSQISGIDYNEVFSPTLRLETLRLILTLLAVKQWSGRQVDFKTAFLNGHLDEPVYMEQPPGFVDPLRPDYVCEVSRSLYGLKQSPRQWNKELHLALIDLGMTQSSFDPTLYFTISNGALSLAISTHVDDLAVVGPPNRVSKVIAQLGERFKIGADEPLHHFLSMKIDNDPANHQLFLSQQHYVEDLATRFPDIPSVNVHTPTDAVFKDLCPRLQTEDPSPGPYSQLIGSLLWLSQCTRPDIAFSVNRLSQFLRDPSVKHWNAAARVLAYVVTTKHLRLRLGGRLDCCGYSDSDWAEDRHDRRSTSAYTFRIGCGAISWKSRKQATVSLSSTEAEYKALSDSCKEGLWLRNILSELSLRSSAPIPLHVDNEGAEALAKNPAHHARTKHIDARFHFIRECVADEKLQLLHVSTQDMMADMLTKPLARPLLEKHREKFGVI